MIRITKKNITEQLNNHSIMDVSKAVHYHNQEYYLDKDIDELDYRLISADINFDKHKKQLIQTIYDYCKDTYRNKGSHYGVDYVRISDHKPSNSYNGNNSWTIDIRY